MKQTKNKDKLKEYKKNYYYSKLGKKKREAYYKKNKKRLLEYQRKYLKDPKNREKRREFQKEYYNKNREKMCDHVKQYRGKKCIFINNIRVFVGEHKQEALQQIPLLYEYTLNKLLNNRRKK